VSAGDQKVPVNYVPKPGEIAPPPPPPPPPFTVKNGDTTWIIIDKMPVFPGGDAALLKFIGDSTRYPKTAKANGETGKVVLRFVVKPNCTIDQVSVVKSVAPDIDAEAIRVVSMLPKFEKPGIKDGKPVAVWYMLPITFTLK
jgi:protein TonB